MAKRKYKSRVKSVKKMKYNTGGYTLADNPNEVLDFTDESNMSPAIEQGSGGNNMAGTANQIGGAVSKLTPMLNQPTDPSFAQAAQTENAVMGAASSIPVVGGTIGGADAIGEGIGGPIRKNLEKTDHAGNINNKGAVKAGAIIGGLFDPMKALTTRGSYKGGFSDISGDGYVKHLESIGQEKFRNEQNANSNAYLNSIGEASMFANGGETNEGPSELTKFFGPSHAKGGINIGGGKEVEGGETMKDGFVHSDRIGYDKKGNPTFDEKSTKTTFADKAKKIDKLFIDRTDTISKKTKEMMYAKVENDNAKMKPIADAQMGNDPNKGYNGLFDGSTFRTDDEVTLGESTQGNIWNPNLLNNESKVTPPDAEVFNFNKVNKVNKANDTQKDSKIGFTPGDYANMASSLPSIGYNFAQGLKKAEVEDLQLNPEADKIKQMMAERKINFQSINNELVRERTKGSQDIGNNTRGIGSRNANLQGLYANSAQKKAGLKLQEQQANNTYRGEEASTLNNLGQQESRERIRKNLVDAQNKGTKQNFIGQGFVETGEGLKNTGNALNTNSKNNMTVASVNALSQRYGIDKRVVNNLINQGYSGNTLEQELVKYKG